jgi:uncharacterized protein (DUF488 family)
LTKILYTIGHSTRSIEEFLDILKNYNIEILIDVRRFPSSRKFPWFNRENIRDFLKERNMKYVWLGKLLGGFRTSKKGNQGYFSGYIEYMETPGFKKGVEYILKLLKNYNVCVMCAERFYFKCHRKFISKILKEKGVKVIHVFDNNRTYVEK